MIPLFPKSYESGFTLLEMIVSLTILGIIVAIAGMGIVIGTRGYIMTRENTNMALSEASAAQPPVLRIASSAQSPSMECQLISGSLTAVSRILLGSKSSQWNLFFLNALIIGFFRWEDPAIIRGILDVFPRRYRLRKPL